MLKIITMQKEQHNINVQKRRLLATCQTTKNKKNTERRTRTIKKRRRKTRGGRHKKNGKNDKNKKTTIIDLEKEQLEWQHQWSGLEEDGRPQAVKDNKLREALEEILKEQEKDLRKQREEIAV